MELVVLGRRQRSSPASPSRRCWLFTETCSWIEFERGLKINQQDEGGSEV
ncbi:hypothetical protein Bca4012_058980 [Brassica carinata]